MEYMAFPMIIMCIEHCVIGNFHVIQFVVLTYVSGPTCTCVEFPTEFVSPVLC